MEELERITQKLAKLQRLIDDAAASDGEKASARERIAEILRKNNLTPDDVCSTRKMPHVFKLERKRWGRQLLLQCAAWLFQLQEGVPCLNAPTGSLAMRLTAMDAAELRAVYAYYSKIMEARELEIKETAKAEKQRHKSELEKMELDKKEMLHALLMRYNLFGPRKPVEKRGDVKVTDKMVDEYLRRQDQVGKFKQDAWQRGDKLNGQDMLVLH